MTAFNVLDREESVFRHLFLEASAGTGKTFAIENIVARLICETADKLPLLIENILVVTFTKMATGELKERIHSHLEKCLALLKRISMGEDDLAVSLPDYLLNQLEKHAGHNAIFQIRKRIEAALFSFDQAQIFTIHGFCWRMLKNYSLEAEISLDACSYEDQSATKTQLLQVISDFLRFELSSLDYGVQQLKIIMERAGRDLETLQNELLREISRGVEIEAYPPFSELLCQFQTIMKELKIECGFEGSKILDDCLVLTPLYKGLSDTNGKIHEENWEKFERFAALFNQVEWSAKDFNELIEDGIFLLKAFDSHSLKVKAKPLEKGALHYPDLLKILKDLLEPLFFHARSEAVIFSRLAKDCQAFVRLYQEQEERFTHSDLLIQMRKAIEKPAFLKCVRENYSAAMVDEFQDTDPVQWEIFSRLFSSKEEWDGYFHLIGDPKQSIYAFRQADIYTYLRAAEILGSDSLMTLETNFRSQPSLIEALNALFNSTSDLFSLPKLSRNLPYRSVLAGRQNSLELFKGPPLQFWEVKNKNTRKKSFDQLETDLILPAIGKEILKLNEKGIRFNQFAILVSDRYQEKRVFEYLKTLNIPAKSQKVTHLSDSSAVHEMRDLLNGVNHYQSKSSLNIALACRMIGFTHHEIALLDKEQELFPIVEKFHGLQKTLYQCGFATFYRDFMNSSWHTDGKSVIERLLMESDGPKFYREWQDLADLVLAEEYSRHLLPQGLVTFLDELEELSINEDERIGVYVDHHEEGVAILTTHLSKGLEFDIVFALGLIMRPPSSEGKLILLDTKNQPVLGAVKSTEDPRFLKYCEEIDAEKMRQLYVALTRAREKLYVPFIVEDSAKTIPYGCASPMELFLAKLGKPSTDYHGIYQNLLSEDGSSLSHLAANYPNNISILTLHPQEEINRARKEENPPPLVEPKKIVVPGVSLSMQSFTFLAQAKKAYHSFEVADSIPHDFFLMEKTEHTLPSGNETGVLLHKIFELFPFETVKFMNVHDEIIPLILPFLQGTAFDSWADVIAKVVFNALKTNLAESDFCLADIHPKKIYREMEFLYACDPSIFEGTKAKQGYLKGVVDVFFEHQNKFYLIDWKTNWLGPSQEYYRQPNLEEAMKASDYHLQAKIYCEAFKKYLSLFDQRPFKECFGGIYYYFVRGISPTTGMLHISNEALE